MCIEDGRAALEWLWGMQAERVHIVGFSLGGAVATQIGGHPLVASVIGLAPWLPEALPVNQLAGRVFHVLQGTRDPLLGTPGVSPRSSRAGFDRILAAGATGTYTLVRGGVHAIAVRGPFGGLVPMPRARVWAKELGRLLALSETVVNAR
jgi:dienelactone hydrolase